MREYAERSRKPLFLLDNVEEVQVYCFPAKNPFKNRVCYMYSSCCLPTHVLGDWAVGAKGKCERERVSE